MYRSEEIERQIRIYRNLNRDNSTFQARQPWVQTAMAEQMAIEMHVRELRDREYRATAFPYSIARIYTMAEQRERLIRQNHTFESVNRHYQLFWGGRLPNNIRIYECYGVDLTPEQRQEIENRPSWE